MAHFPVKRPLERLLAETRHVALGTFGCAPADPRFRDSGPSSTYCFVFPRTHVWIRQDDADAFLAGPTVATLYNQGQRYTRASAGGQADRADWCAVDPALLEEAVAAAGLTAGRGTRRLFPVSHVATTPRAYARQRRLFDSMTANGHVSLFEMEETAIALLAELLDGAAQSRRLMSGETARARNLAQDVRRLLAYWFDCPVELADLASTMNCSVFHLCRTFRKVEGTTIHAYLLDLRLRRALECLRTNEAADITRVALDLGFSSHSHFTAAFRQAFGMTPSAWRGWRA